MSLTHPYYTVTAFFRQEAKRENTGKQALFHTLHRQVLKMGRDISWVFQNLFKVFSPNFGTV